MSGTAKPDKPKARSGMSATGPMRTRLRVRFAPVALPASNGADVAAEVGSGGSAVNLSGALGGSVAGFTVAATSCGALNAMAATLAAIVLAAIVLAAIVLAAIVLAAIVLAAIVLVAVLLTDRAATRSPVTGRTTPAVRCGDAATGAGVGSG